uniref:Uncharacterized protein n=1 Tax=Nelumbo nucifera TaxID=4432 RepID=A0A822YY55_NELNU|nr:TPA_asm: hypothetical protein HUJ06_008091 [Nelumbo nucifera]
MHGLWTLATKECHGPYPPNDHRRHFHILPGGPSIKDSPLLLSIEMLISNLKRAYSEMGDLLGL